MPASVSITGPADMSSPHTLETHPRHPGFAYFGSVGLERRGVRGLGGPGWGATQDEVGNRVLFVLLNVGRLESVLARPCGYHTQRLKVARRKADRATQEVVHPIVEARLTSPSVIILLPFILFGFNVPRW